MRNPDQFGIPWTQNLVDLEEGLRQALDFEPAQALAKSQPKQIRTILCISESTVPRPHKPKESRCHRFHPSSARAPGAGGYSTI